MSNRVSTADRAEGRHQRTGRAAVGLLLFAALMMFMVGMFQALTGLVAILAVIWAVALHGSEADMGR